MTPWPYPFWFAHRGAGRDAPENTLRAFRVGQQAGFRAFECDVQLSQDGVPFLLHDDTLERTTNGHGLACDQAWSALSSLDAGAWLGPDFAGEPVTGLADLAAWAAAEALALNLELKPSPGQAQRLGVGLAHWLDRHWQAALPPLLSSFEPEALRAARGASARWPLALLREEWSTEVPRQAASLGAVAVVCHHGSLSPQAIAALHAQGLRALAYTVNDRLAAQALLAAGVDGLITDALGLPVALGQRPLDSD